MENNLHITEADYNTDNHLNHYIESKILAEQLVRGQDKVPYAIIRPRGLCGVGDQNMLPVLINANKTIGIPLFEKGEIIVDLCSIENVALALRLCMEKDEALGQVYNITNGDPRKLTDLADQMFGALGMKVKYRKLPFRAMYGLAGGMESLFKALHIYNTAPMITRYNICTLGRSQVFDITKAREELGYAPKVSLDEMISKYAAWYKEHEMQ
jgi:nucleoside-diphosphate-sugar epimerase